ncbi:FAD-dependent monooxygenase [Streptomyces sp. NPDC006422]|uniref:FAD-dependent monooxygenase n=1 Tax=unclassified Streptomyces TaxID=2593676 RepID=UPI0033B1D76D
MNPINRPGTHATNRRTILISGAGIAGPALAYWLTRYGFAVTVVEKAHAPRHGGYPIDIRGTALEAVQRMGLMPQLRDAHIDLRRMTFLDGEGGTVAALHPHTVSGGVAGHDLEVRRGDLTGILYAAARDDVEFLFNDSIDTLDQSEHGVDVTFHGGDHRTFDMLIGADGAHSRTRRTAFGPEEPFHHYLGYRFAIFTMPNTFGLSHETVMWNTPGRAAALYAVGETEDVHAFLNFSHPRPKHDALSEPAAQRELLFETFADAGWKVPDLLTALHAADDVFFDAVAQIRMPRWSSGRVALVGDSAYAPSFLTGQGTSLALVGAYMLAHSLAANSGDYAAGFAAYEHATREFVSLNQGLVTAGDAALFPTTAQALRQRNDRLRSLDALPAAQPRPAHSALTLPDFADLI